MKENKLTEGSNMMWEASRIILPEHKEVINRYQEERNRKTKPVLAEEEVNIISQLIHFHPSTFCFQSK
ncbi:YolD-like family protein [Chengkuizengella sediminis]|uniref:YolD-like family protein n=1 Tax=Chengkuizengella sediminis TaxID=1885917 RepID=UPI00138994D6|nr:YolD-like family protein [Chengkuizengella sediminis]NDI35671.1 YolD-like family protein [Chengkuizengella sediminis]